MWGGGGGGAIIFFLQFLAFSFYKKDNFAFMVLLGRPIFLFFIAFELCAKALLSWEIDRIFCLNETFTSFFIKYDQKNFLPCHYIKLSVSTATLGHVNPSSASYKHLC